MEFIKHILIIILLITFPFLISLESIEISSSIRYFSISIFLFISYLLNFKNNFSFIFRKQEIVNVIVMTTILFVSLIVNYASFDNVVNFNRTLVFLLCIVLFTNLLSFQRFSQISKTILFFLIIILTIYFTQCIFALHSISIFNTKIWPHQILNSISSTISNKNLLASLLILSFPFIFHLILFENKKWKVAGISCIFLIIISLALIQSKNAFIALSIFGVSCFVLLKSFKVIKYFILSLSLVFVFYLTNKPLKNNFIKDYKKIESLINNPDALQNFERARLYRNSIKMFVDNPIIGVGPGNWKIYFPAYGLKNSTGEKGVKFAFRPHSDFLLYFTEGGIFAGILFILLFYLIIKKSLIIINTSVGSKKVFFCIYLSTIFSYVWLTTFDFPNEKPIHLFLFAILTAYLIHENKDFKSLKKTNYLLSGSLIIISSLSLCISYMNYNGSKYISEIITNKISRNWGQLIIDADKSLNFGNMFDHTGTPLHWYTGLSYFNQNQKIKAKENFLKSYELHPNHIHVLNNLAVSFSETNSIKSLELLKKCNNISPRFEECSINLSKIYNSMKNYEKSLDCLLNTINTNNDTENDFSTQFYEQSLNTLNLLYLSYYGKSFGYEFDKRELFNYLLYICNQRKLNKPFMQSL